MTEIETIIYRSISKDYIKRSGNWYGIKCPFCGDSRTPKSVHLYIRLAGDSEIALKCYRIGCDVARRMTVSDAIKLGISDQKVLTHLATTNRQYDKNKKNLTSKNNIILTESVNMKSIEYFKQRTDIDIKHIGDLERYSLVLDLNSFINKNEINNKASIYKMKKILESTDNNVVGFLNRDRTLLYVRNIIDDGFIKHDKINLYEHNDIIHSPYEIKSNVENKDRDFYIIYSEGCFDAVNVSYHMMHNVDHISLASLGFSHLFPTIYNYSRHYRDVYTIINRDGDINPLIVERYLKSIKYRLGKEAYYIYDEILHDMGDYSKGLKPKKELITLR